MSDAPPDIDASDRLTEEELAAIQAKLPASLRTDGKQIFRNHGNSTILEPEGGFVGLSTEGVHRMARAGFSAAEIAKHFGCSRRKFFQLLKQDDEVMRAFRMGRSEFSIMILGRVKKRAFELNDKRALFHFMTTLGLRKSPDKDWPKEP